MSATKDPSLAAEDDPELYWDVVAWDYSPSGSLPLSLFAVPGDAENPEGSWTVSPDESRAYPGAEAAESPAPAPCCHRYVRPVFRSGGGEIRCADCGGIVPGAVTEVGPGQWVTTLEEGTQDK